uniref:Copper-exporting P-type ATPase A n=1 Tax=Lygus hesperus TaxID=30085 RepID=A0A0A9ZHL0_LYGHE
MSFSNDNDSNNIRTKNSKAEEKVKVAKSPPAAAVKAAATFIKTTLVGKRGDKESASSSSSKHVRKERNAIPVLGSAYAACPYYLHSIEYILGHQLPFVSKQK